MIGTRVSAVTAYTAHREWASRPPDERFASVHALYDAARARSSPADGARRQLRRHAPLRARAPGGVHRRLVPAAGFVLTSIQMKVGESQ